MCFQLIRHLCETLCAIPTPKNAAPLLNYACRTGNNELLKFGLKMGGVLTQVCILISQFLFRFFTTTLAESCFQTRNDMFAPGRTVRSRRFDALSISRSQPNEFASVPDVV
jgi:hypothetical protein